MVGESSNRLSKTVELRQKLTSLIDSKETLPSKVLSIADVIITANEVNEMHGTGVLISRIFTDSSNIFSIRSSNHYNAAHSFGNVSICISHRGFSRSEVFSNILREFNGITAKRVLCVPYYPDDVLSALVVKELFGIPLCTYIMDDQNICSKGISDELMEELLKKSSLCLAISPEMQYAYEQKYSTKFWLLPPVVSSKLLQSRARLPVEEIQDSKASILIGNIWGQRWLELLRETIRGSGIKVHWYCNRGSKSEWLTFDKKDLEKDGIIIHNSLKEPDLVAVLRNYAFAIVPSGVLDETDDNRAVAQLSLPTRIPFVLATSNTPVIILGSRKTAAARFVERFQVGIVCDYNLFSFRQTVDRITSSETQLSMRQNSAAIADYFSADEIDKWIWRSLELGEPCDLKFEKLMPRSPGDLAVFIEPPVPNDIYKSFIPVYQAMRRLKLQGFYPDFVVDVGASTGVWSYTMSKLFTNARFILIDPLTSRYEQAARKYYIDNSRNFEVIEVAVSNQPGKISFQVSPDLYGSSLLQPTDFRFYETIDIEVETIDRLVEKRNVLGRGILKLDVQCAEHLVLEGACNFLSQVDVIVAELSLIRYDEQAKILSEMLKIIEELGFRYYDDTGCWRSPVDGTLLQKDILFVRKNLFVPEASKGNAMF